MLSQPDLKTLDQPIFAEQGYDFEQIAFGGALGGSAAVTGYLESRRLDVAVALRAEPSASSKVERLSTIEAAFTQALKVLPQLQLRFGSLHR